MRLSLGLPAVVLGTTLYAPESVLADPAPSTAQSPGVESSNLEDLEASLEDPEETESSKSHQRGGKPKVPRARLPQGVPLSEENAKARRSIAAGPTQEELRGGPSDPALQALRDAENVLFPEPVRGLQSSWSFDLPEPGVRETRTLGLPLTAEADLGPGISKEDIAWLKSLTMPDLPIRLDRRVVTYLKFYRDSPRGRTIAAIWTKKSGRYIAEMKSQFRRAGLPSDLVWLSMIESGHNPTIASPAGAVGLWQFMPASARMYGLTVDRWVDERRDPARSTQAAVKFLGDLYRRFGNWELSLGAYNMGYAGMSRAVVKYNTNDFWALSRLESGLPWETTLYVPKIFALAIVMNNRDAFGVGGTKLEPAVGFDSVLVEPATPLKEIARAAGVSVDELRSANPQFLADRLPPQQKGPLARFSVRVPRGVGERATHALDKLPSSDKRILHRVRLGDTSEHIAAAYGVSESSLLKENSLSPQEELLQDTVLLLPSGARRLTPSKELTPVVVSRELHPGANQRLVFYRVTGGESLPEIAAASGVPVTELARWNVIDQSAHLRPGMTLQLLVEKDRSLSQVRVVEEAEAQVLLAGSREFHEHFESLKGKSRVLITVREGDTLARVGSRYGMSVGSMERVNRRSRHTKLIEGEQLIVYTEKKVSTAQNHESGQRQSLPPVAAPYPELLP